MAKRYRAIIRVKGVMNSPTEVEVFANNIIDARKIIIAQFAQGDARKVSFFRAPYEIR
ncbi:MAG: hypothetical protein WCY61_02135 [Sphaerochaeta sp.]